MAWLFDNNPDMWRTHQNCHSLLGARCGRLGLFKDGSRPNPLVHFRDCWTESGRLTGPNCSPWGRARIKIRVEDQGKVPTRNWLGDTTVREFLRLGPIFGALRKGSQRESCDVVGVGGFPTHSLKFARPSETSPILGWTLFFHGFWS